MAWTFSNSTAKLSYIKYFPRKLNSHACALLIKFDLSVFSGSCITTMTPNLKYEFRAGTILLAYILRNCLKEIRRSF